MTAVQLVGIVGAILSLLFSYVPGLSGKYDALDPTWKRIVMGVLLVIVSAAIFGLSCGKVLAMVTCDKPGVMGLLQVLFLALTANQAVYMITVKPAALGKLFASKKL